MATHIGKFRQELQHGPQAALQRRQVSCRPNPRYSENPKLVGEVLSRYFPKWISWRTHRGGQKETTACFKARELVFEATRDAYVWLVERFAKTIPEVFTNARFETTGYFVIGRRKTSRTSANRAHLLRLLCAASATLLVACVGRPHDTEPQSLARRELDAMHQALLDAHPGAIDDQQPGYRELIDANYASALARLNEVRDERDAMSLADWYAASFHDVHLHHSNDVEFGDSTTVSGWNVARAGDGRVRVNAVLPDWPVTLPPVGAELLSCDGRPPERLVEENVLSFTIPRPPSQRDWALSELTHPAMSSLQATSCRFRLPDGREVDLAQQYRSVGEAGMSMLWSRPTHKGTARVNDFQTLADGTLWIRAGNFQLDATGEAHLVDMLAELEQLKPPPRRIVFDVRGNGGGNSTTGDRIFTSATGGLVYDQISLDQLPRTTAWWRVSAQAIAAREALIDPMELAVGKDDPGIRSERFRITNMREALSRGERWMAQGEGTPLLSSSELERRRAHLARFAGPVALLTDGNCVSACLDFADRVRSVPGAIHLGEATGFDSVYLDIGMVALPSGNNLVLPLKVWRNRLRGNDQPWVPQVSLNVTGMDDAAVQSNVVAELDRLTNK